MLQKKRLITLAAAMFFMASVFLSPLLIRPASAAQITTRSLTLQGVGTNGGSNPNVLANHLFTFTLPTDQTLGSIKFEYCTNPDAATSCVAPNGLTTAGVSLGTSTGAVFTSAVSDSANVVHVTRAAAAFTAATGNPVVVQLLNIHNPDNTNCYTPLPGPPASNNCTFFVRISSYASTDTSGGATDTGSVAASTATPIFLQGYMPESLVFCTGATIGVTGANVPDCSQAGTGSVAFPDFSPTTTSYTTSQMAASTNANTGYVITYTGATMTSGANTITAMGTAGLSNIGTSQFGMNLVLNTNFCGSGCNLGNNVTTTGGTVYNGQAIAPYNVGGDASTAQFKFASGDAVANSANAGSDAQIFTSAYIVNVPGSQPAGTYSTTLTYICTPTF